MHPFLLCCLEDLNHARARTMDMLADLSEHQWQRRIPGGAWTVRDLAAHTVTDRWALASLAELFNDPELVTTRWVDRELQLDPVASNARIQEEDRHLSLDEIFNRGVRERKLLATSFSRCGDAEAEWLYRYGDNLSGYHDRMHHYDFLRALQVDYDPIPDELLDNDVIRRYRAQTEILLWAEHSTDWNEADLAAHDQLERMIASPVIAYLRDLLPDYFSTRANHADDVYRLARTREAGLDALLEIFGCESVPKSVAEELRARLAGEHGLTEPLQPYFLVHRCARAASLATG